MISGKYKQFWGLLLTAVCVLTWMTCVKKKSNEPKFFKIVDSIKVSKSQISRKLNLIGIVKAKEYSLLRSKRKGVIRILIPSGTKVRKNEIVAITDNKDIRRTFELSASAVKTAKIKYERMRKLTLQGIRPQEDSDNEKQQLISAQKAFAQAGINNEETIIRAPFDGILGIYKVKSGEYVSKEYPVVYFYNPDELTAEFDIPSQYAHQISPGQKIFINDKEFKLTQIQKITDEDTHMCPAYVEINNADFQKDFIPGTSIDIQLILEEKTNTVVIPRSAVFIKNKKNFVYVLDNQKIRRTF